MTPLLDVRTMVLLHVCIRLGQAVVLLYLWSVQRNYPPAKDWAIGATMSAFGLFLFTLRGYGPVWVAEVASNALLLPGWMLFDYGIAKAAGKTPPLRAGLALCAAALIALAWQAETANYPASVVTQNLVFLAFDLYAAHACLKVGETGRTFTFRFVGILLLVGVAACLWRVAGGVFGLTLTFSPTLPRLFWIATSLITFSMITILLTLHTSQRLQEEINEQARRDALTGAYNRRAFYEFANAEWTRAVRYGSPLSVLSVDIDHFKEFNDRYGHEAGDAILVQVSTSAQAALRSNDVWCRSGGEEFVALLPNTSLDQARAAAERLRLAIENTTIASRSGSLNVTVSIGVAQRSTAQSSWSDVVAASDAALYKAKAAGRNRAVVLGDAAPGTSV